MCKLTSSRETKGRTMKRRKREIAHPFPTQIQTEDKLWTLYTLCTMSTCGLCTQTLWPYKKEM